MALTLVSLIQMAADHQ